MERTKPLDRPTAHLKRKVEDSTPPPHHESVKLNVENDLVCEICEKVDFFAFFTSKHKPIDLCPLSHILSCTSCPFCKLIVSNISGDNLKRCKTKKGHLKLVQQPMSVNGYLRKNGIEVLYLLKIWLRFSTSSGVLLTTVEACDGLDKPRHPNARMVRIPRPYRFEPQLLLQWLTTTATDFVNAQKRDTSTVNDSIHTLIGIGKLRAVDVHNGKVVVLRSLERYIALSYVWGENAVGRRDVQKRSPTQSADVASTTNLNAQPATIRDAASLVRQLGERYLWVDALCIDQEDHSDKPEIIANMDAAYRCAYFTIVAADGIDANAGLTRLHGSAKYPERPITVVSGTRYVSLLPKAPDQEDALQNTVWNSRGWTYQEMMLSTKSVVFTKDEVYFSSHSQREQEAYSLHSEIGRKVKDTKRAKRRQIERTLTTQEHLMSKSMSKQLQTPSLYYSMRRDIGNGYVEAVEEYSRRDLTYEGDRLDAFSGVLKVFAAGYYSTSETQTLSGLLEFGGASPQSVCFSNWRILGPTHRIEHDKSKSRRLPSWSWIGWSGAVESSEPWYNNSKERLFVMNAINVRLDRRGMDPWPFEPAPCVSTPDRSVILHLWAPVQRCRLVASDSMLELAKIKHYSVVDAGGPHRETFGTIRIDGTSASRFLADETLEVIAIDSVPPAITCLGFDLWWGSLILISSAGEHHFSERVGVVEGDQWRKIRRGDFKYRHIKMI